MKEVIRSGMSRAFWAGIFAHAFFMMFYQDLLGKDEYLRRLSDHWVDIHWAVGLVLATVVVRYYHRLKEKVCGIDPLS